MNIGLNWNSSWETMIQDKKFTAISDKRYDNVRRWNKVRNDFHGLLQECHFRDAEIVPRSRGLCCKSLSAPVRLQPTAGSPLPPGSIIYLVKLCWEARGEPNTFLLLYVVCLPPSECARPPVKKGTQECVCPIKIHF